MKPTPSASSSSSSSSSSSRSSGTGLSGSPSSGKSSGSLGKSVIKTQFQPRPMPTNFDLDMLSNMIVPFADLEMADYLGLDQNYVFTNVISIYLTIPEEYLSEFCVQSFSAGSGSRLAEKSVNFRWNYIWFQDRKDDPRRAITPPRAALVLLPLLYQYLFQKDQQTQTRGNVHPAVHVLYKRSVVNTNMPQFIAMAYEWALIFSEGEEVLDADFCKKTFRFMKAQRKSAWNTGLAYDLVKSPFYGQVLSLIDSSYVLPKVQNTNFDDGLIDPQILDRVRVHRSRSQLQ